MRRTMLLVLLLLSALAAGSCNQMPALATLNASVQPAGDTTGNQSAVVNINFTNWSQPMGPVGNDQRLRFSFSDVDGNTMDFVLTHADGKYLKGTYNLDTANNTFAASFTVTYPTGAQTISVTNGTGSVTLLSDAELDESGVLQSIGGQFSTYFTMDGVSAGYGSGTFQASRSGS
ncbi:MAG: hypothetical protein V1798_09020 [Pseudomonadota bacterium]